MTRPFITWAVAIAFSIMSAGDAMAQASREPSKPYSGHWATTLPKRESLIGDEVYRRDGVVGKVETCLIVAADDDAFQLWNTHKEWHGIDAPLLSLRLDQQVPAVKKHAGFGTILACAQILKTWYTGLPTRSVPWPDDNADGRLEHGSVVIDLGLGADGRASIDPRPLVRLLTSPNLLPSWAFGGIVIRRAAIQGTLLLHNMHLSSPLVFADVRFIGGGYRKDVFAINRSFDKTAISIGHSRISDYVMISDSMICGDVRINDSYFGDKVEWRGVTQKQLNAGGPGPSILKCSDDKSDPAGFHVFTSEFSGGLNIVKSRLGQFQAHGNVINRLDATYTDFGAEIDFLDNDIGSMVISRGLAQRNLINYNRIKNDFFIFGPIETDGEIESISINRNRIGGGIGFLNFPSGVLPETIRMESNHIGNGSLICLPRQWRGTLSLDGSSYDGKLAIGATRNLDSKKPGDVYDDSDNLKCSWLSWETEHFQKNENEYCEDLRSQALHDAVQETPRQLDVVKVELEAVEIRTMVWQLPLKCEYRWSGFGLDYRLWQPGDRAGERLSEETGHYDSSDLRVFKAWRTTLWGHDPAPLDTMSRYLTENGAYNESRAILLEAKRLNYVPACRPDRWSIVCALVMLADGARSVGAEITAAAQGLWSADVSAADTSDLNAEDEESPKFIEALRNGMNSTMTRGYETISAVVGWVASLGMLILLLPGGYGAQPERAIVIMVVSIPIFWIIYRFYSYKLVHDLANVPDLIKPLANNAFAAELVQQWPRKAHWMRNSRVYDRSPGLLDFLSTIVDQWRAIGRRHADPEESEWLEQVQGPLMRAVEKAESDLEGEQRLQLVGLRHQLERFGNTDVIGFSRFDRNKMPTRFTRWQYSFDTMLPVIDLHAYSTYYPIATRMRVASIVQHGLGWWLSTVFIASAAIL